MFVSIVGTNLDGRDCKGRIWRNELWFNDVNVFSWFIITMALPVGDVARHRLRWVSCSCHSELTVCVCTNERWLCNILRQYK